MRRTFRAREAVAMSQKILVRREGVVGALVINNPERHNAVSEEMWEAIAAGVATLSADASVRVITVRGAGGKAFVSGADISRFEAERAEGKATTRSGGAFETACKALYDVEKPTVAIINGWCLGGGAALAVSCDLRIAADDARFGVPAAKLSIGYGVEGLRRIVDLVGIAGAKEIMFTGRRYTADEALRMGLVNRVIPRSELDAFAHAYVMEIAENAPLTIRAAKAALAQLARDPAERDWNETERLIAQCGTSNDHAEGTRAFMEKRKPMFTGT
jgi:enoyl-CoA hydratase/carnithine racemase